MIRKPSQAYVRRIDDALSRVGLTVEHFVSRGIPLQVEAQRLASAGPDVYQREQRLAPGAARGWLRMQKAAAKDGIEICLVSAFRSVDRQVEIIQGHLKNGRTIEDILRSIAPPGFSEHHTGRAIDLTLPGDPPLEETFEATAAFAWLKENAERFRYSLSYPRDNPYGFRYEPWHWFFDRR